MTSALLVYPFGGSDLAPAEGPAPRGALVDRVKALNGLEDLKACWTSAGGQQVIALKRADLIVGMLPILGDTIAYIAEAVANLSELAIQPIITAQHPPHPGDTATLAELSSQVFASLEMGFQVRFRSPWRIESSPFDYASMINLYRDRLFPEYVALARQRPDARRYVQVTPGTPAMSMATAMFNQDPDATFLYTAQGRRTSALPTFAQQRQEQTTEWLRRLAFDLQWGGIAARLEEEGNGFTPIAGPHPWQGAINRAKALDAWSRRHYSTVAGFLTTDRSPTATALSERCNLLTSEPNWTAVVSDAVSRVAVAHSQRDIAGLIMAVYAFNDAAPLWALTEAGYPLQLTAPSLDLAASRRVRERFPAFQGNFHTEPDRIRAAWALADKDWIERYMVLHWILNGVIDPIRNALIHGGTDLAPDRFQPRLVEAGLEDAHRIDPIELLYALVCDVGPPRGHDDPVFPLHSEMLTGLGLPKPSDARPSSDLMDPVKAARNKRVNDRLLRVNEQWQRDLGLWEVAVEQLPFGRQYREVLHILAFDRTLAMQIEHGLDSAEVAVIYQVASALAATDGGKGPFGLIKNEGNIWRSLGKIRDFVFEADRDVAQNSFDAYLRSLKSAALGRAR